MRILFIAQFYPPEMGAAAARISGLAGNLAKSGHEVSILTGFPNYPSGLIDAKYRKKLYVIEKDEGVTVNRVWVYASPRRKFYTRLLNYFSLVFTSIIFELFDKRGYDIVIASSPPLFIGISGYAVAKLKSASSVLDVRDIWPKIGVDTGELSKDSFFIKIAEKLEDFLYKSADLITVVTEYKLKYLLEKETPESKIKIIPNGVDREYLSVDIDSEVSDKYFTDNKFTVVYAGLMGIAQGVQVIVEAANILKNNPDMRFYIIGEGVEKAKLIKLSNKYGLTDVVFIDSLPKEKIATFIKLCDVCVVPLKMASFTDSVPSKLLETMAFGCPVILSAAGESASIVEKSGGGLVTSPSNSTELAEAIKKLYDNPELKTSFSKNGVEFVDKYFMRDKIAQKLEDVLIK